MQNKVTIILLFLLKSSSFTPPLYWNVPPHSFLRIVLNSPCSLPMGDSICTQSLKSGEDHTSALIRALQLNCWALVEKNHTQKSRLSPLPSQGSAQSCLTTLLSSYSKLSPKCHCTFQVPALSSDLARHHLHPPFQLATRPPASPDPTVSQHTSGVNPSLSPSAYHSEYANRISMEQRSRSAVSNWNTYVLEGQNLFAKFIEDRNEAPQGVVGGGGDTG